MNERASYGFPMAYCHGVDFGRCEEKSPWFVRVAWTWESSTDVFFRSISVCHSTFGGMNQRGHWFAFSSWTRNTERRNSRFSFSQKLLVSHGCHIFRKVQIPNCYDYNLILR